MNMPTRSATTHNAVAARGQLSEAIRDASAQLRAYLPPHVPAERFLALAQRAVLDNPDLAGCSTGSVLRALSACAASGLLPDGKMSSLIVRKSKAGRPVAVWDPSYRGMVYLALESGHVVSVQAAAVHERDAFNFTLGTNPSIAHRPAIDGQRGKVIAAYAVAHLKGGGTVLEVLTAADLAKIKAASPAGDKGPWGSWAERMATKSAVRRLLKRLPAADVGTLARAQAHVREYDEASTGAFAARLDAPDQRASMVEDNSALEARALEALSEVSSLGDLQGAWEGIRAEFSAAGAEIPLAIEARHRDRREALEQVEDV